jgi:adenosylhomocysteine nucleosidase
MAIMAEHIAIIAALPREIAALVRSAAPDPALRQRGIWLYRLPGAVVVAAGMGSSRVALAVEAALAAAPITVLISAGLAGACVAALQAGDVLEAQTVVDVLTGERFETASIVVPPSISTTLATAAEIASVSEKRRLADAYGAFIVDMEAATVARLARAHGLRFRAIKGISDRLDFELEALGRFTGKQGSFRTGAFALHTALRPSEWGKAMELGRGSKLALDALTQALNLTLELYRASGKPVE